MIGYLKGKIQYIGKDYLILLTSSNVGYKLFVCSAGSGYNLENEYEFYVYTHVRENEISLFGFTDTDSMKLFELLIDVNGVGPKLARNLMVELGTQHLINSILSSNFSDLRVSGVGEKSAKKIVLELSDKIEKSKWQNFNKEDISQNERMNIHYEEALQALLNLGYTKNDINRASRRIEKSEYKGESTEKLIKILLSKM